MRKKFLLMLTVLVIALGGSGKLFAENGNVAKVGSTEYATIDEAIAAWTNNTTLTLLADVTLSDVVTLSSQEHHYLALGTYTMTAASGKNAIELKSHGKADRGETGALTITADPTNPGSINAGSKVCIYYKYDATLANDQYDRPIIYIKGGVFVGSSYSGISCSGHNSAQDKCATFNISGGTFNCGLNLTKAKLLISGGTFNYSVNCTGGGTSHRQISGGTFKAWGFMTADAASKFWVGTSQGNYNVGVHVDDNGYLVVGGAVVNEAGDMFEASSANYGGWNSYLQYSSAKDNGLYYTSVEEALADNNKDNGSVTVYVDKLDMTGISYKGTIVVPEGKDITITNAPSTLKVKLFDGTVLTPDANGTVATKIEVDTLAELQAALDAENELPIIITETIVIPAGETVTIDLNGKTITGVATSADRHIYALRNNGNLTIKDSKGNGSISARGIYNGTSGENTTAVLVVEGGTFYALDANGGASIFNYANLTVNGGTFDGQVAALNGESGEVVINGGTFRSTDNYVIQNKGYELTINKATVDRGFGAVGNYSGTTVINDGTYLPTGRANATCHVVYVAGAANLTINGGTFKMNYPEGSTPDSGSAVASYYNGTVLINGGSFTSHFDNVSPVELSKGATIKGGKYLTHSGNASNHTYIKNYLAENFELSETGTVVAKPVAQIGETTYTSIEDAIAAAQAGNEIKLLADIEGDITVPANVTLNGNGFAVSGAITAAGEITFAGVTKTGNFGVENTKTVVNIPAGASLQLIGTGRMVIGHGCTFNITGTIADAKNANVADVTPSLVMPGASFTGAGVTFNVTNAYIKTTASYCSSSKSASGTFDFNINNSIWEQFGKLAFEAQSTAAKVDFALVNSVLTTTSHLVFGTASGEEGVVIDNSLVNEGTSRQIENRGTMTIKNGSVVNGSVATSSNAKNPGTVIVENATYAVTGEFSGSDLGTGTLIIKKGATVSAGSITKANITIDAEGMTASDAINLTANLSKLAGELSVINNDKLEAKIVDGKVVLAAKPVAKIGEQGYATIKDAVAAVQEGETITILAGTISEGTVKLPATLKNVTLKGSSVARSAEGAILKDMTISAADGNSYSYVNLTFDGITFDNSRILLTGWRNGEEVIENLTVTNCTFKNIYDDTNTAPVHINKDATEAVKGFTFTNNVIDGATGGSKSGIYAQVTGNVVVKNNIINNVSFRPYVIQVTTDDGIADNFVVKGNTFSGSAVGRAQGLGNNAEGTDNVNIVVSNNIFKGITDAQQICYWNFNAAKTTADLSKNYYDIDIEANPSRIYYNAAASNTGDLVKMGVFPIYTELAADGTINTESAYYPPVAKIGDVEYTSLQAAIEAVQEGETVTVLEDITFTTGANGSTNGISYTRGASFTLDLNGKTITSNLGNNALRFKIGDGNTVRDTEVTVLIKNGKIVSGANNYCAISAATADNSGNKLILNLTDLTIEANKAGDFAVKSWAGAVVNTNNVDVTSNYAGGFYAVGGEIVLDENSSVAQKGLHTAPYMSYAFGVSSGTGKMTINGGIYSAVPAAASDAYNQGVSHGSSVGGVMSSGGTLIINGGTFSNDNFGDAAPTSPRALLMADAGAVVTINGGTFNAMAKIVDPTNNTGVASKNAVVTIAGGKFSANPTDAPYNLVKLAEDYIAVENNGVWNVVKAAAKVGEKAYATLEEAFKAATSGCTIDILSDVTVDSKWDCRYTGSKFTVPVTINGNGKTIKFTASVNDNNWNTVFRFEENATVNNLTVDIANATGAQRVISAKKSLNVDGLNIVGAARYGVIYGEGASATDLAATEIVVKNSTLGATRRAVSDNEGGKDVKSVVIEGNTFNANVYVSASESISFNNNTANGEVDLRSYTAENVLSVEAKGNTLTEGVKNYIYAKTIDAQDEFETKNPPLKVSNKAELDAALAAAKEGNIITLTADIDYGTTQLAITKAITLDLGGKILTTQNAYGGMSVKNNPTIKNGTIVHKSNTAAIKVWNATAFEDLVIDVQGKGDANKTIGGIVLQSGSTTRVGSIKNVTIKGAALTNGIETYNCGDATENVIGAMENVTINAQGTGMLISAPCGTATNCSISGGTNGIEIWIKGNYSASLDLVASKVEGGVYAHDEFNSNPGVVNNGTLNLTADAATTGAGVEDVTLTIARAENLEGVIEDVMEAAQAKIDDTYYTTIAKAIKAAQAGQTVTILEGTYEMPAVKAGITIEGAVKADGTPAVLFEGTLTGTLENLTMKNIHIKGGNAQRWAYAKGNLVFKNVTFEATSLYALHFDGITAGTNLTYTNCTIIGWAAMGGSPASCTFDGCTIKGNGTYGVIRTYFDATIKNCTFDVANVNTTDAYQDGIHAVEGAKVTVTECTNKNGDMIDLVNIHALSIVELDGVEIKNVVKTNGNYYRTLAEAFAVVGVGNGKTVELIRDVDLASAEWTPVDFNGVFDGQNHTISNLVVNGAGKSNQGFFGTTQNGEIKNVTFNNAKVTGRLNVGVVAGTPYTSKYTNVTVTGHVEVNGYAYVGGVGGKNAYANWTDITVNVDETSYVKADSENYRTYVGGVVGFNGEGGHTFKNISSNIKVIGSTCDIGGIFGIAHYNNKFENITFTGAVEAPADAEEVGGIAGVWHNEEGTSVTFTDCTSDGTVTIGGETTTGSIVGGAYNAANETEENSGSLIINGKESWLKVAQVGEVKYLTLAEAVAAVTENTTITMLADVELTSTVTVAKGQDVTLNLNGKTISAAITEQLTKSFAAICNKGTLTVKDSATTRAAGRITVSYAGNTFGYGVGLYTISNEGGTLEIESGIVENTTTVSGSMYDAIDNNSTLGETVLNITGGEVRCPGYIGIRQFANSTTHNNIVNVTGGKVVGGTSIWMQNPGSNQPKATIAISGDANIEGHLLADTSTGFKFDVTGGTFTTNVEDFCAEDFSAIQKGTNLWVVKQTSGELTRTLPQGWSWFSSYVKIAGAQGLTTLESALGTSGVQIKDEAGRKFAQYSTTSGWYGSLTSASSEKMYSINTSAAVDVNLDGDFFGVENYKPILAAGWNYMAYPHNDTLDLATALRGFAPVEGDIIKSKSASAIYLDGSWYNAFDLVPGEGYMYRSQAGTKQVSYTTEATRAAVKSFVSETPEYWTVDATQYPGNMTMIATLDVEGGDYEVAAFVNGELRGSARPIFNNVLDQYIVIMTINGDEAANVTFKYYDFNAGEEYDFNNVAVYSDNAVLGSTEEPYALTRGTTGIGEATLSDINIYPNPTTTDREINLQATCDKVEVFNALGVKVAEYQNVDTIDALETAGTYVIRVTLNGDVKHCRLVVK